MNIGFTVWRISDGRILRTGTCAPYDTHLQAGDGEVTVMGEKIPDHLFYFHRQRKTPRPVLDVATEYTIAADGVDAVEFPLPAGSSVIQYKPYLTWDDEDEFHFSTEQPGTYEFHVHPAFPLQSFVVTIHAT